MSIAAPFGRLTTAMITPFKKDGEVDWAGVEKLAAHLVSTGHDGLVLNGTTTLSTPRSAKLRGVAAFIPKSNATIL